jgi:hypothetical protein
MKNTFLAAPIVLLVMAMYATPAFAIKGFQAQFLETYKAMVDSDDEEVKKAGIDEAFIEKAEAAKCYVCHIKGESKKKRNKYGEALHEYLSKKDYPSKRFKEEPEEVKKEIEAVFKKVSVKDFSEGVTFADRMKEGLLPGGDEEGKVEGDAP